MSDVILPGGTTVGDLIANLNVFVSNPATSRGKGEIIFNSTDNEVYKNTGTAESPVWVGFGGGGELINDTTPQLGGDLDCNEHNITNIPEAIGASGSNFVLTCDTNGAFVFRKVLL
jgi:hypothetical protein